MTDQSPNLFGLNQSQATTSCIKFNAPPTEEVLRLDKEGFHYKGEFIADAGEAHRLMVAFLKQNTAQPEPVAPTDEELIEVFWEHQNGMEELWVDDWPAAARAVLTKWGHQ